MNQKRFVTGFVGLMALLILSQGVIAQPAATTASTASTPESRAEETGERASYLDRHRAIQRVAVLKELTILDIQRLKILVANFEGQVGDAQASFEEIKRLYREAQEQWYRRRFVDSLRLHEECRTKVQALYKQFTDMFKEQVAQLLADCSEQLVNIEFSQSIEPGLESNLNRTIRHNSLKLKIAYQQTAIAEDMLRHNRHSDAVTHYRLAKMYAIDVLRDLEQDPARQQEIENEYRVHLLDARGMTAAAPAGSSG
ncbi:MAG: hypothetical protein H7A21_06450 [Spirochaetales bacterium]|nr:hypothetical protein [Leptospiraceae bacterium]MCP5481053.1 hypothetical protein [Spirochaetales bacterium]MCP5485433.1 hypothetical protein [Spirochaetales bacterium]